MATYCVLCGKKLGLLDGKVIISDGTVCSSCWASAGFDMSLKDIRQAHNKTTRQLRDLIEIEVLKTEATKAGLRKEIDSVPEQEVLADKAGSKAGERPNRKVAEDKPSAQDRPSAQAEPAKPIDIILTADRKNGIGFACSGNPVISFDDLINGKEMVIGDGHIKNKSGRDLPEIRIGCEFDPPIIDSGLIYYEAGTFKAGLEGTFEIDDPPINLEEYAKIKRQRKGKVRLTLFVGEQEMATQECPMIVKAPPAKEIKELMDAVVYEEEKNSSGPVNVFLNAREGDSFTIDLQRRPELLYSMYSNGQEQLIGDVFVSNDTGHALKDIRFEADFSSDILSSISMYLGDVPNGANLSFEVDDPAIDIVKLEMLTEIETCIATYRLLVGGKTVAETTGKITICPFDQWNAALILLPAYMTPNHPNVINVLQHASKWMLVNGMNPSLEGYQSDGTRVEEMVRAVFNSLKEANIIYSNPPASFFGPQRIRLAESVFEQHFATCLDITILFASCLESFGLHPVLITAPSHIFAGVWLTERGRLREPIVSDAKLIQSYIKNGQLVALECTAMTTGGGSYEKAKKSANEILDLLVKEQVESHECVDVQIARAMGVRPLPLRVTHSARVGGVYEYEGGGERESGVEPRGTAEKPLPKSSAAVKAERNRGAEGADLPTGDVDARQDREQSEVADPAAPRYATEEYRVFDGDLSSITIDNFYERQSRRAIKTAVTEIVDVEGPISQPALIKVLVGATGLARTSRNINEYLDKLVAAADVKITRQNGTRFLWRRGVDPKAYATYRVRELRSPDDICKFELRNAVCYLLQEKGPMQRDELVRDLVDLFGYKHSSKKVEAGAQRAIKAARELKAIVATNDGRLTLSAVG